MRSQIAFVLFSISPLCQATLPDPKLVAYPGYAGDLHVTGKVNAYLSETGSAYLTYDLNGLEDACKTTPEGVGNACGIHIHEGKSCDDASAVGGHYYDTDSISSDPWSPLVYKSIYGHAFGSVKATVGDGQDISGRAIVVHDSTGGRVACALLPSKLASLEVSAPRTEIKCVGAGSLPTCQQDQKGSQCLESSQCAGSAFCCPYMKKCITSGMSCQYPIASCSPTCFTATGCNCPGAPSAINYPSGWQSSTCGSAANLTLV